MIKLNKETLQVNSMAIKKAKYNYKLNKLRLTFVNGKKYDYFNVPLDKFLSMKYAESIGKFIHKHILKQYNFSNA
jgi:hypothetical protein